MLHIVDLDGGTDIPLQYTGPFAGWHAWSPAGDAIVYEKGRGGSRRIDVIDVATRKTREVIGKKQFGNCKVWAPDWSPVSDRIVFTTCQARRELYAVNIDGTALTFLAGDACAPGWAPDGSAVYVLRGNRLMRVAASGGPARRLGVSPYFGGPFSIGLLQQKPGARRVTPF